MVDLTRTQRIFVGLLLLVVILVGGITFYVANRGHFGVRPETKEIFIGTAESQVSFSDLEGNDISLESYLGDILVVSAWASWSPFSAKDLVALNQIAEKYDTRAVFIAINRKESKEQAARYLATLPELTYLHMVIDQEDHFYDRVEGYAMPETLIFDKKGNIILHDRGALDQGRVESTLDSLLKEQ